jgi:hypothetical protein
MIAQMCLILYQDNQYTTAIRAVGSIIEDYDTDKMFPGLGFGAKIPSTNEVSHDFFLNLQDNSPYCQGMDGLLQAYHTSIQNVRGAIHQFFFYFFFEDFFLSPAPSSER